jgi:RNA polymerase sigma factor (sigma-70 family)
MDLYAFEDFFREHYPAVRRALILGLGSIDAAEDATQEAFIRACVRWPRVREMERPAAWVYVTAVNVAKDEVTKAARRSSAQQEQRVVRPSDEATNVVTRLDIADALEALAPRQRLAVVLRYLASLRNDEVARAMNCSVGTVKATLHSALKNLRVDLEEANP